MKNNYLQLTRNENQVVNVNEIQTFWTKRGKLNVRVDGITHTIDLKAGYANVDKRLNFASDVLQSICNEKDCKPLEDYLEKCKNTNKDTFKWFVLDHFGINKNKEEVTKDENNI